ncbi:MAG: hemolysin family protein [Lachnospiraceae bacterium]|nr:hemolysin family protein [Lachnospiraceae bacterium]
MDDGSGPWNNLLQTAGQYKGEIQFAVTLAVLFVLFALIHGFEKAMQGENESLLEKKAEEGDRHAALLLNAMQQQTSFTCIRLVLMFGTGFYTGAKIWALCLKNGTTAVFLISGLILLFLVIGIMVPRKIAVRKGDFWLNQCLGAIRFILFLFRPITAFVDMISNLLLKLAGFDMGPMDEDVTEEEIISMVNEGNEQGVLEDSEARMITNIMAFGDKNAGDIMTRRLNIIFFDGHCTLQETIDQLMEANNSRFPVFDENTDNIVGILYLRDAMTCGKQKENLNKPIMEIEGLLRKAEFIPETRKIDRLFQTMQLKKIHMMLVVDEYGQLTGLVTMEDLLEEIVGSILDEYDEEALPYFEKTGEEEYIIDGMAPLEEVEKLLDVEFETEDIDTINGFLLYKLGYFPKEDESAVVYMSPYEFTVLEVENKMIQKIKVARAA